MFLLKESPVYSRNVHQKCSNIKKLYQQTRVFENNMLLQNKKNNFKIIYINKQILRITWHATDIMFIKRFLFISNQLAEGVTLKSSKS